MDRFKPSSGNDRRFGRDLNLVSAEVESRCGDSSFMEPEFKGLAEPRLLSWHQ
jgi:hypothetical protein